MQNAWRNAGGSHRESAVLNRCGRRPWRGPRSKSLARSWEDGGMRIKTALLCIVALAMTLTVHAASKLEAKQWIDTSPAPISESLNRKLAQSDLETFACTCHSADGKTNKSTTCKKGQRCMCKDGNPTCK